MRTISILLALINALLAGLMLAFNLSPTPMHQTESWWLLIKLLAASSVIVIGVLTWVGNIIPVRSSLVALACVYLVALGAGTIVWTFHLALVRGGLQFYRILFGGSLFVQGTALLLGISQEQERASLA